MRRLDATQHLGIGGHPTLQRLLGRHTGVDHTEIHLRGFAEDFLQPCRVLQSRHLNQHAIETLALDQRLDRAEFVDALFDDLDRLLDRLPKPFGDRRLRNA